MLHPICERQGRGSGAPGGKEALLLEGDLGRCCQGEFQPSFFYDFMPFSDLGMCRIPSSGLI